MTIFIKKKQNTPKPLIAPLVDKPWVKTEGKNPPPGRRPTPPPPPRPKNACPLCGR